MYSMKCYTCHKMILFNDDKINHTEKSDIVICPHCSRSVIIQLKGIKYYDKVVDKK